MSEVTGQMRVAMGLMLVLAASQALLAQEWDEVSGPNLVRNPSFEEFENGRPVAWSVPAPVYSVVSTNPLDGEHCLQYVNDDPQRYWLCSQTIKLEPGAIYEMAVSVRTQGLVGEDTGATICIEWADAGGRWLGGSYPSGLKGDVGNWTRIFGRTRPIPAEAASCTVKCYVRRGMTGTAWWDDVSVRRVRRRPLETFLLRPRYRGWITDNGPTTAEVQARFIWNDLPGGAQAHRLVTSLTRAEGGPPLATVTSEDLPEDELRVSLRLPELTPGQYLLQLALQRKDSGETVYTSSHRLQRRSGPPPRCYVDEHNRLIVDGQPFFPLGMYWGAITEADLDIYAQGPFNCIMPYSLPDEQRLDWAHQRGIRVIYSIKDFYAGTRWCPGFIKSEADEEPKVREYVRRFRNHPAVIAWYLNDELPLSMRDRLEAHQRWVEEEDPDHPTWVVLYQVDELVGYLKTFDVIGTDPYPIGKNRPLSLAADWTIKTREAVADARALWMVPQAFQWNDGDRRPTRAEMRCMAWQCICEGADGLIFYSWSAVRRDQRIDFEQYWADMCAVGEEIKSHVPVLLSVEPTPPLTVTAPPAVHWTARTVDGVTWLFMVNDSAQDAQQATVRPATRPTEVSLADQALTCAADGSLSLTLEPMAVVAVRLRW